MLRPRTPILFNPTGLSRVAHRRVVNIVRLRLARGPRPSSLKTRLRDVNFRRARRINTYFLPLVLTLFGKDILWRRVYPRTEDSNG